MAVIDDASPAAKRYHRGADAFRQRQDLRRRMQRTAANPDHRRLRRVQQLRQRLDLFRVRFGIGESRQRLLRRDLRRRGELIPRHLQRHRTAPPRHHFLERPGDQMRRLRRMFDPIRPFHQGPHGRELVGQFVQLAPAAADHEPRHLPGQAQHWRVHAPGGGQRGGGVQHAGPGDHGIGRRAAGGAGIAKRHVSRCLFMAGVDQPDTVGCPGQRIEQPIRLHARQPEHRIDSVPDKAIDDRFSAGHARHGLFPFLTPGRWHAGQSSVQPLHDRRLWKDNTESKRAKE